LARFSSISKRRLGIKTSTVKKLSEKKAQTKRRMCKKGVRIIDNYI
jgi:hypothetical protein